MIYALAILDAVLLLSLIFLLRELQKKRRKVEDLKEELLYSQKDFEEEYHCRKDLDAKLISLEAKFHEELDDCEKKLDREILTKSKLRYEVKRLSHSTDVKDD